ncbi:MAG TPA: LuxR C-terminal-related transcriptional regulator [Jatrophihabitans sp.]|nr:LuxR C-terminal-related transcriptional regulator [Jatrophihabitans sp.]
MFGLGVPTLPASFVPRPRLFAALDRGVRGPLTLVSAPAGTGKTLAVASWVAANRAPGPLAWVSLSEAAGGCDALWSLLVEALRRSGLPAESWAPRRTTPTVTQLNSLARHIASLPEPVTVVLDCDVDLSEPAADAVHHLLSASQGGLRLIVLVRADPLLPLHLYRLEDTMVEIRWADLAFTRAETEVLLARRGVRLPGAALDIVCDRTRGWAAGLQLASMTLANCADPSVAARNLSGASGTVAEYLMSEVLDAQAPPARRLLLETSVVEVLHPGLAEALAGPHAPRALTFLARGNAFVEPVPDTGGAYRYHPLFRDLLYAQLAFECPADLPRLHKAAASWFASVKDVEEATRHAVAAGEWETAARYLVDDLAVARIVAEGAGDAVSRLFEPMPDAAGGPAAALIRAALALAAGDRHTATHHVQDAAGELAAGGWAAGNVSAAFLETMLAGTGGDVDAVSHVADRARRLLETLPDGRAGAHREFAAMLEAAKAAAFARTGNLAEAATCYTAAVRGGRRPGFERACADWHGRLALLAAWVGRYRKAAQYAERAQLVQQEAGLAPSRCSASAEVAAAWVALESYDLAAAHRHVVAATECRTAPDDAVPQLALALVDARLRRAHGDLQKARDVLDDALKSYPDGPSWLLDRLTADAAAAELAHSDEPPSDQLPMSLSSPAREEALLARAQARLTKGKDLDRPVPNPKGTSTILPIQVDRWLLESYRRLRRGEAQQAAEALNHSLRLAAPEQLRRPFREAPADVRRLLRGRRDLAVQHRWLLGESEDVITARDGRRHALPDAPPEPVMVEQLTHKELEVLGHLAELLTTEEIAGAMFVSVNTVRTHVRNILRKLAVSRRNEAIRRARELGVLA